MRRLVQEQRIMTVELHLGTNERVAADNGYSYLARVRISVLPAALRLCALRNLPLLSRTISPNAVKPL